MSVSLEGNTEVDNHVATVHAMDNTFKPMRTTDVIEHVWGGVDNDASSVDDLGAMKSLPSTRNEHGAVVCVDDARLF